MTLPRGSTALAAAALLVLGAAVPAQAQQPTGSAAEDPVTLVNPFVGTQNFGNTFPGASAPFGMVQVSPDTGGQGGYDYQQGFIHGFSQTHLSGVGCPVAGELPIMPTTGAVTSTDHNAYRSAYSHDDEEAEPGYYRVGLQRYGIGVELTATPRTGWQRYSFPAGASGNVLLNTGKANQQVLDSQVRVVDDRTVEGRVRAGRFCAGLDEHTVYFTASFDRPFQSFGTWRGGSVTPGAREASGSGGNGAYATFDTTADRDVVVKVGLSYTGIEGARKNLAAETDGHDFDAARAALRQTWREQLGRVEIGGGELERRKAFYTSLYHSVLHPNLAGDVDGRYTAFGGQVKQAQDFTPHQNFSLWDTYRPQNQLLELLEPEVARDVALSVLAAGRDGGWLPRWALANSETNIMTGDPVTPFLVEAWSRGLLKGHEAEAYELLKRNATSLPPDDSPYNGRSGVEHYLERGYVPSGLEKGVDCPHKGGDNDCAHPASATLEYAAADAALALMAEGLGQKEDARTFAARGKWYRNLWDSGTKHFRPRTQDGTWLAPYDPVEAGHQFHEGGAYQYQWLVPQDPDGLVDLMGGRRETERRLDAFFAYDKLLADPEGTARTEWITQPYDYYGKPTYNPNNEPDLHAPYTYLSVGAPAKTATVVRAAMTLFTDGPDGMTGNDDLGTMSAWYVFSSLGLYPTMSGASFFALSSPQFPSATVHIGGTSLAITAPGASDANRYVQRVALNGKDVRKTWLSWDDVARGGSLQHRLGTSPSTWGTSADARPPSISRGLPDTRTHLDAALRPSTAVLPTSAERRTVPFTLDVLAQSPLVLPVSFTASAPDGWRVPLRPLVIPSFTLPAQREVEVPVSIPANTPPGTYEVSVTARGPGATTAKVAVEIREAVACAASGDGWCAVDLSAALNHDGAATVAAPGEGDFDGGGWSYDAALLPSGQVTWGDVTYTAPDTSGTAPNFVEARGQALLLPEGRYPALNLVGASHNGPVGTAVTVRYTDGTSASAPVVVADWAGSGSAAVLEMPHRIKAGVGVDSPPVRLFGHRVALDPAKVVQSVVLPADPRVEVFAATLG
ncbi:MULTISPECIES: GH92 family glycosyl hydrolase [Actinosynnema]|uniref:GH92 family glycosyl hydrolase n=1 Tax=Actinosynnema TaxID=40566 RepID=UPI0020A34C67|nr:GH92 family glycosyl hydrolase [Actinosynnema pretiosum]MCP2099147.1 putative alpha-1,2-mannosidase [Actinosynnema pretiosum]